MNDKRRPQCLVTFPKILLRRVPSITYPKIGPLDAFASEKTKQPGSRQGFDAIAHLKLAEDLIHPPFGRAHSQRKAIGNFLIGHALVEESQNFDLDLAQRLDERVCGPRTLLRRRRLEQARDERGSDMPHLFEHRGQISAFIEEYAPITRRRRERYCGNEVLLRASRLIQAAFA